MLLITVTYLIVLSPPAVQGKTFKTVAVISYANGDKIEVGGLKLKYNAAGSWTGPTPARRVDGITVQIESTLFNVPANETLIFPFKQMQKLEFVTSRSGTKMEILMRDGTRVEENQDASEVFISDIQLMKKYRAVAFVCGEMHRKYYSIAGFVGSTKGPDGKANDIFIPKEDVVSIEFKQ